MRDFKQNVHAVKSLSMLVTISLMLLIQVQPSAQNLQNTEITQVDSLSIKIGQMVMIGLGDFNSATSNDPIFNSAKSGKLGGIVIYEKNINPASPKNSMAGIIEKLQKDAPIPLFTSVDEEGGKVSRFKSKYGFHETKRADILGQWDQVDSTYVYALRTAKVLASMGINLNYAPDVDVNINPTNPVIGSLGRSYGSDPYLVAKHGSAVVSAHRAEKVGTVIKHFPGHGSSTTDTHMNMTDVTTGWRFTELLPFKAMLDSGLVDGIMTAHIINEHLDPSKVPATLSKPIITGILREFMGYDGVVFSDDMQMYAISKHYGLENAIKMSIHAGVDVLMFANNVPQTSRRSAEEIHSIIYKMVKDDEISEDRIDESFKRILKMKKSTSVIKSTENLNRP